MRYLAILSIFISLPAFAADGVLYKDCIVVCTVDQNGQLTLPFKSYGQDCVQNGQSVTYELEKHKGEEVMAKVDYVAADEPQALAFQGNLGSKPLENVKYAEKYSKKVSGESVKFCEALSFQKAENKGIVS